MTTGPNSITIRNAYADDESAINRLAALDSAGRPPAMPLLLAEVDGDLRAALSLRDSSVVADPFHRTVEIVELLRTHAESLRRAQAAAWRSRRLRGFALPRALPARH
jgi:hypothetical protein